MKGQPLPRRKGLEQFPLSLYAWLVSSSTVPTAVHGAKC